jgi:hypothetical protein
MTHCACKHVAAERHPAQHISALFRRLCPPPKVPILCTFLPHLHQAVLLPCLRPVAYHVAALLPAAQVDGPAGATAVKLQEAGDPVALQREQQQSRSRRAAAAVTQAAVAAAIQCARTRHVACCHRYRCFHPRGRHYQMSHAARRCAHQTPLRHPASMAVRLCPSTRPVCLAIMGVSAVHARAHILCCYRGLQADDARGCATSLAADSRGAGV